MTTDTTAPQTNKRAYVRVDVGLYQYTIKPDKIRFKASIKHRDRYFRKFGFPTISKARQALLAVLFVVLVSGVAWGQSPGRLRSSNCLSSSRSSPR